MKWLFNAATAELAGHLNNWACPFARKVERRPTPRRSMDVTPRTLPRRGSGRRVLGRHAQPCAPTARRWAERLRQPRTCGEPQRVSFELLRLLLCGRVAASRYRARHPPGWRADLTFAAAVGRLIGPAAVNGFNKAPPRLQSDKFWNCG
ncbi:MAG: hypothetical protein QOH60_3738 [Mycobacterium sp.]|nr:hypothetical protein [Mycobacterium sp.]